MSILVDRNTRVLIQGITGREGRFHCKRMLDHGTNVVAGVSPGKGGSLIDGIPVYDDVASAVEQAGATASVIFVPAQYCADAIMEAADSGLELVVCITEGIPVRDMVEVAEYLRGCSTVLIGPNCPGVISPGKALLGIMPGEIFRPGPIGVVSRSGTLTYEVVNQLTPAGFGQSTCIGIGGDPVIGTRFIEVLRWFEKDSDTQAVVLLGEIGGTGEEEAAEYIRRMTKPVVGFVAGRTAPPGKRMGHAGAIISGGRGTAESKIQALREAGAYVARTLSEIPELLEFGSVA